VLTVAYLANQFPSAVEPYVMDEIEKLRSRGIRVVAGSVRKMQRDEAPAGKCAPEIVLEPLGGMVLLRALWLCLREWKRISPVTRRIVIGGNEGPLQRVKALVHTWMGGCYAVLLEGRGVEHIHVHHGYFGSWIAMVAARLLRIGFSMTLHGSDLLLHSGYLDMKLESCAFCLTVSKYNRSYILKRYPQIAPVKVIVSRLGVEVSKSAARLAGRRKLDGDPLTLLAVGRLHAVKDHAFLVRACAELLARDLHFACLIAGEGPERLRLESLIRKGGLEGRVTLLGHVPREQMDSLYDRADIVVLTSRSEGIPLVLMEAMARGKIVLAPAITGIPELVLAGRTGFLYEPGSLGDFLATLLFIHSLLPILDRATTQLDWIRHAARVQVRHNFNRRTNLESFGDVFLGRIVPQTESIPHENLVLQQI
jgi:glycosyltransferase involved in cell wall biosynthesis